MRCVGFVSHAFALCGGCWAFRQPVLNLLDKASGPKQFQYAQTLTGEKRKKERTCTRARPASGRSSHVCVACHRCAVLPLVLSAKPDLKWITSYAEASATDDAEDDLLPAALRLLTVGRSDDQVPPHSPSVFYGRLRWLTGQMC